MDKFWLELLGLVFGMPPFLAFCHWMHRKKWERLVPRHPFLRRLTNRVNAIACLAFYFLVTWMFWVGWQDQRFLASLELSQVQSVECDQKPLARPDLVVRALRETHYGSLRGKLDRPDLYLDVELKLKNGTGKFIRVGRFRDGTAGLDVGMQTFENTQLLTALKANGCEL